MNHWVMQQLMREREREARAAARQARLGAEASRYRRKQHRRGDSPEPRVPWTFPALLRSFGRPHPIHRGRRA